MPEKMRALYKGGGGFVAGVPARHLTQDEYAALSDAERAAVRDSGLYEVRSDEAMAKRKSDADGAPAPEAVPAADAQPQQQKEGA